MNRCLLMARVRDARIDDVKAIIVKEKNKKIKYLSSVNGDFHKPKSNLDLCTNLNSVCVLGQVILNLLQS